MRIHGRGGVAYLSRNSGDPASPVAFLSDWAVDFTRTVFDVTSIVDAQHIYASGSPDVSGSFTGFYDTATVQSYTAAVDGQPRDMFLYPSLANTARFFSGPVLPDYKAAGGVTSAVALSVTWSATGRFTLATGSVTASPAALAVTTTFPAPSVTPRNATASPATLAVTTTQPAVTVTTGSSGAVYGATYTATYGGAGGSATVTPATLAVTIAQPAVTVSGSAFYGATYAATYGGAGGNATVTPATLAVITTRPAATVSTGGNATVTPATLSATGTVVFSAAGSSSSITLIADNVIAVTAAFPVPAV